MTANDSLQSDRLDSTLTTRAKEDFYRSEKKSQTKEGKYLLAHNFKLDLNPSYSLPFCLFSLLFIMRSALLACVFAVGVAFASAAPNANVCDADTVQLELRPSGSSNNQFSQYELAFVAIDPKAGMNKADFIDIHYRVNNEDSVNLRVLTEAAITNTNERAKQAQVEGIQLEGGDVIRAYATYSSNGIACDTPIHTFNAPEEQRMTRNRRQVNNQYETSAASEPIRRRRTPMMQQMSEEDHFWTAAAIEAEQNHAAGACPAIAMDQQILRQAGSRDAFVLAFENKTPGKQLHYVDLHMATDADQGWDNLRLASDMQLDLAHKVMQPGVVIKPNQALSWYWSYRTSSPDGLTIDCTTPITTITAAEVTHEVDLNQIIQRA